MFMTRRDFVGLATAGVAVGVAAGALACAPKIPTMLSAQLLQKQPTQAIAFDALAVFDPRSVFELAEQLVPGKGASLSNEWRTRQFEYTWLRVAAGRYADFWQVTQDALVFAGKRLNVEISQQQRDQLMNAYLELKVWPDVPTVLARLRKSGYRLAFLSNFTRQMLHGCIRSSGLDGTFDEVLSTDQVKTYKPDPRAYRLGCDVLKLGPEAILFVVFAGWDAAGAKSFGYPTFWSNRLKLPAEELGETADGTGDDLSSLMRFLGQ
jgi:2-haloacid dehalogenase